MSQTIKRYVNSYTVGGTLAYLALLILCYNFGTRGQLIAFILAPIVVGGFWYWMRTVIAQNTVRCACGGMVTNFAGRCPCGRLLDENPMKSTMLDVESRRTSTHN